LEHAADCIEAVTKEMYGPAALWSGFRYMKRAATKSLGDLRK